MQTPDQIADVLFRYLRNELSPADELELGNWRNNSPKNEEIFQKLTDPDQVRELMQDFYSRKNAWNKVVELVPELQTKSSIRKIWWKPFSVAASIFLTVGLAVLIGLIVYNISAKKNKPAPNIAKQDSNVPGDKFLAVSNKAILTLSNGKQIFLDSSSTRIDIKSIGNNIGVLDNGKLSYTNNDLAKTETELYNVLTTPRGGQYLLSLPDGSQVWLNAASTIRYPIAFTGNERKVEITGEGYFEVTKNAKKPFSITIGNKKVQVLGTHFNINSYSDEPAISVTLLEGSIKLQSGTESKLLTPGEQARISNNTNKSNIEVTKNVDVNMITSWRNGRTFFKDADVQSIMRIVSRWYNIDVVYKGNIPERSITGGISKNENLSEILKVLEWNKIHYTFSDNQIIITP